MQYWGTAKRSTVRITLPELATWLSARRCGEFPTAPTCRCAKRKLRRKEGRPPASCRMRGANTAAIAHVLQQGDFFLQSEKKAISNTYPPLLLLLLLLLPSSLPAAPTSAAAAAATAATVTSDARPTLASSARGVLKYISIIIHILQKNLSLSLRALSLSLSSSSSPSLTQRHSVPLQWYHC